MSEFAFKLTDNEWNKIEQYLPTNNLGINPKYTNREILDCIIYIIKVGCQWRTLTQPSKSLGKQSTIASIPGNTKTYSKKYYRS